jgi:hypothetical protein
MYGDAKRMNEGNPGRKARQELSIIQPGFSCDGLFRPGISTTPESVRSVLIGSKPLHKLSHEETWVLDAFCSSGHPGERKRGRGTFQGLRRTISFQDNSSYLD